MSVILKDVQPPLLEVSKLKGKAAQVYLVLWQSAAMDTRWDKRRHLPWENRRDCGGTSHWTVKGIADHIGLQRKTVSKALCVLLDAGFISVVGYQGSPSGSDHTIWRVTHPDQLAHVKESIEMIGLPSKRWQKRMSTAKSERYTGEIYDCTEEDPSNHWTVATSVEPSAGTYNDYLEQMIDYVSETDLVS